MSFLELVKNRYSARNYKPDRIEQEKLDYIIECARQAPSAVNYQPWHLMVVTSNEGKRKLQQCYPREWFAEAPAYIAVCVDQSAAWVRKSDSKNHADIDAAIAAEHICLSATERGLGSCWVCNFDPATFKSTFQLPLNQYPVAIISLGYVKEPPKSASARKEMNEIVSIV